MAIKSYRGRGKYSDMKLGKVTSAKIKNANKLDKEYLKLKNDKQKYEYLRSNYYTKYATAAITCHADIAEDEAITLISTTGTSVTYTGKTSETLGSNQFKSDGNATVTGTSLCDCINNASGHNGEIVCTDGGDGTLTLTQKEPGPHGNTTITDDFDSAATVPSAFTGGG